MNRPGVQRPSARRAGARRAAPVLVAAVLLLASAACGESKEAGPVGKSSREPVPTARISPPANPQKQTKTLLRGTTGWVGGLRLGIGKASDGTATVFVLEGYGVPAEGDWKVSGKARHSQKLDNGYTVTIDQVVNAKSVKKGETGSGGGSVTVTVTPLK
jgi:hypothetical protein